MAASNAELELRIERNTNDIAAIYELLDENKQLITEGLLDVDRRFDQVDQRFDKVDQRLDRMQSTLDRIDARG
ncbi:hypothetical protein [Pimelobacter simplex]|uniref:hypothetical protein n=1 Tax=Nocardioides simplex TaxID=2045 RepID=UPI00215014EA|nr:hypothetical protein [Pimelobacter simplex]UUW87868.1 hypothetical protein M0M43_19225 [Pimelobacter simplex]UUW97373.1 hypothetical protein M0M48_07875 [Pimelobacter simplex]